MQEKTLNDLPRDLRMLYTKGFEAYQRENYDYAIEMFTQVLAKEPTVFEIRKVLARPPRPSKERQGRRFLQACFQQRQFLAHDRQGPDGPPQKSARSPPHRRANSQYRRQQRRRSAHRVARRSRARRRNAARRRDVPRISLWPPSPKDKEAQLSIWPRRPRGFRPQNTKAKTCSRQLQTYYPSDAENSPPSSRICPPAKPSPKAVTALAGGKGSYRDVLKNKAEVREPGTGKAPGEIRKIPPTHWSRNGKRLPQGRAEPMSRCCATWPRFTPSAMSSTKHSDFTGRIMATDGGSDSSLMTHRSRT